MANNEIADSTPPQARQQDIYQWALQNHMEPALARDLQTASDVKTALSNEAFDSSPRGMDKIKARIDSIIQKTDRDTDAIVMPSRNLRDKDLEISRAKTDYAVKLSDIYSSVHALPKDQMPATEDILALQQGKKTLKDVFKDNAVVAARIEDMEQTEKADAAGWTKMVNFNDTITSSTAAPVAVRRMFADYYSNNGKKELAQNLTDEADAKDSLRAIEVQSFGDWKSWLPDTSKSQVAPKK